MTSSLPPLEPAISQLHALSVESLIYEKQRLDNSIFHLSRSNEDMKEFDKNDKDFQLAIKENEDLIARHREKIKVIQDLLKERQNGNNCITIEHTAQTIQDINTRENNNADASNNVQDEEMEDSEDGIYL